MWPAVRECRSLGLRRRKRTGNSRGGTTGKTARAGKRCGGPLDPRACVRGLDRRPSVMLDESRALPDVPDLPVLPPEATTRAPVIPTFRLPYSRSRYPGLVASVALHLLLLMLLVSHGER